MSTGARIRGNSVAAAMSVNVLYVQTGRPNKTTKPNQTKPTIVLNKGAYGKKDLVPIMRIKIRCT